MADTITVRAAKQSGKAILWDVDDRHPHGEIFISGNDTAHDVAETGPVLRALADGRLVKVTHEQARAELAAALAEQAQNNANDADTTDEPSDAESSDTDDSGASDDGADGDTDAPVAKKRGGKRG